MSVRVDHKKRRINFIAAWFLFIIFIIGTGQLVHAEAKNVVMFPPTPTSTPSPCLSWDLAADFRVSPNQENPNRDSCNNPNVWQFMVGSGLTHDPLSYSLASYFTPNFNGTVDVNVWSGTSGLSWPFVGYNASSQTQLVSWLAHTINVHPSNNQLVIVAWKSALNGYVSISGGVADADPACGSGIQWTIDRDAVALASGSYVNGGSQTFSNGLNGSVLNMVAVNVNSMLYVIVDPNGDDLCDTTRVDLVINMVNPLTPTQTPTPLPKPSRTPTSSCILYACTPTRTPTRTVTPTSAATSTPTKTPIPSWRTGNSRQAAYGAKADISVPAQAPYLESVPYSGESSWVSIVKFISGDFYWIQAGWRYYKGWTEPLPYVETFILNPLPGEEAYDIKEYDTDLQAWGTTREYRVRWDGGNSWCGTVGGNTPICKDVGVAPPILVLSRSEVHSSSLNELNVTFSNTYYMDSGGTWHLFDQDLLITDSPYDVDLYYFHQFRNFGP